MLWAGVLNIAVQWERDGAIGTMCPTYQVESTAADHAALFDEVDAFRGVLIDAMSQVISGEASSRLVHYRTLAGNLALEGLDDPPWVAGAHVESALTNYASILIRKWTGTPLVYGKGRMYICFPPKVYFNGESALDPIGDIATFCNFLTTPQVSGTATFNPVVSDRGAGAYIPVLSHTLGPWVTHRVWRTVAHQQRRL